MKKLAYSLGGVAAALSFQTFATYIVFFYVDVMKLPPHLAAVAMLFYGLWNAVNDPIVGYLSDRTHSRWGRRIPYLLFGAVPLGLVFALLWVPPFADYRQTGWLFAYFLFFICLFDTLYSLTIVNWQALYPEIFPTVTERSQVSALRQTITLLALVVGIALPPLIYAHWGWGYLGLIFGGLIAASILTAALGVKEHQVFSRAHQLSLWPTLRTMLGNRAFVTLVAANFFIQYAFILILACLPFFAKYILLVEPQQTTTIFATAFLVAIPMLFVWKQLTLKFGARNCLLAALALMAVCLPPLFFVNNYQGAILTAAGLGAGIAGFLLLIDVLLSDVIDEDEVETGLRREGIFFGLNAFLCRFAIGLEVLSIGGVFVLCGYNRFVFTQTGEFIFGLRLLLAGLPLIALLLAFVLLLFYPLTDSRLAELKDKIKSIHLQKGVS